MKRTNIGGLEAQPACDRIAGADCPGDVFLAVVVFDAIDGSLSADSISRASGHPQARAKRVNCMCLDPAFEVVAPPVGATVASLPDGATSETVNDAAYIVYAGTHYKPFYADSDVVYMVVKDPKA